MKLKECNQCYKLFPMDLFPKSGGITKSFIQRRSPRCIECKKIYDREYWQQTKARRNDQKKLNSKEIRKRNRLHIDSKKVTGCSYSGCDIKDIDMLDFDHIDPKTKSCNICEMLTTSIDSIDEEIAKCRVLCANHHRKITAIARRSIPE